MNHRIIEIEGQAVLLDRIEEDDKWQVVVSTFVDTVSRYDEWVECNHPAQAQEYIADFSEGSARQFISRGQEWSGRGGDHTEVNSLEPDMSAGIASLEGNH